MLGGTGSGKGTQSERLATHFNISTIAIGDILRAGITQATELGKLAETYVENGELVPDELIIKFVKQTISQPQLSNGWILKGYPRTAFQAEELYFLLHQHKQQSRHCAIYLEVSDHVMVERALVRGKADDTLEVIQRRLETFYARTLLFWNIIAIVICCLLLMVNKSLIWFFSQLFKQ